MKASIIGIGTEITTGQILNSNGQWISQKMTQLGLEVASHVTVPDDDKLILKSLDFCAQHADILFVTGGLGPTTDDFTRDVVAKWTRKKLVYDSKSFQKIEARLKSRNLPVRPSQKQQCYYPQGAKILENSNGTANGFYLEAKKKKIFVLPGPPSEIEVIWNDHLEKILKHMTKNVDKLVTKSWQCQGLGESEVAHRVEKALKGCKFTKGYRFHRPYVEVKLSYHESESQEAQKWIKKIEDAIGELVTPNA